MTSKARFRDREHKLAHGHQLSNAFSLDYGTSDIDVVHTNKFIAIMIIAGRFRSLLEANI